MRIKIAVINLQQISLRIPEFLTVKWLKKLKNAEKLFNYLIFYLKSYLFNFNYYDYYYDFN